MPLKVFVWCVMAGAIGLAVLAAVTVLASQKGKNAVRSVVDLGVDSVLRVVHDD